MNLDVVIVGGGAAGLFCAVEAGRRGRRVTVVEHAASVGKKIAISGGGRCNFTNVHTAPDNFISANPDFARSALARYTPEDFVALVESHRIPFHEKKLGQLFCDESSRRIIDMLLAECERARVEIRTSCQVRAIRKDEDERFHVETNQGELDCGSLVVATGGLSIPKIGATDFGYRIARQFGLRIQPTRPALVPLTLSQADLQALRPLSGVSIPASVRADGAQFDENLLITHRGLSGPAILQISSYWTRGQRLDIDLLPHADVQSQLFDARDSNLELQTILSRHLPKRFAQTWCDLYAPSKPLKQFSARQLEDIARRLHNWRIEPNGTEGFQKAEVTLGGISTDELSSKTMEARRVPGLYFIGEVVDVTGHLGGYNFQWAWSSGFAAGQYV
ncbi:MAG TPA: NAD(P)/FAD-dependent oxidoreductase [Pyrinomonadaceae bacterium]|jgi:hypothetical protein